MRDIRFRVFIDCSSYEEYHPDAGRKFMMKHSDIIHGGEIGDYMAGHIQGASPLMQFTGIRDKAGAAIYEGDVLRAKGQLWEVSFNDRGFFSAHDPGQPEDWVFCDDYDFEIIGNIHENPELLQAA